MDACPMPTSDQPEAVDEPLFDSLLAHSLRTRGRLPRRVIIEYTDGSAMTLPVPVRPFPPPADSPAVAAGHPAGGAGWPAATGWDFRAGEAAFDGCRFRLGGRLLAILRELAARRGEPVGGDRLKRAVWGDDPDLVDDGNLQGHVSILRKRLREALGLDAGFNPEPL